MTEFDLLLSPVVLSILFGISSLFKFWKRQYEHGFSRLIASIWYMYLWNHSSFPIESQRLIGRWVVAQVAFIEILSFILRAWFEMKYNNALKGRSNVE